MASTLKELEDEYKNNGSSLELKKKVIRLLKDGKDNDDLNRLYNQVIQDLPPCCGDPTPCNYCQKWENIICPICKGTGYR